MKIMVAFLLGLICGIAVMFYLFDSELLLADPAAAPRDVMHAATVSQPVTTPPLPSKTPVAMASMVEPMALAQAIPASTASTLPEASSSVAMPAPTTSTADTPAVDPANLPPSAVHGLLIPVTGVKAGDLVDTFTQARGAGRVHDAIDIMAARGTPVVAANDGHVVKLFTSKPGGLTVYEFDAQDKVIYYYAHLDSYAPGLAEGQTLHRGDPIGFVGSTGNASADAPHLHFEVQIPGPEKQWWHATSINPYGRFDGQ